MSSQFHKSGTSTPLLLVVGLISGCSQKPTPDNALQPSHSITGTPTASKPTSAPAQALIPSAPRQLTVFLPGQDGKLHQTQLKEPSDLAQKQLWIPESALTLLLRKAPQFIPANTRLTDSIRKNKEYNKEHPGSDIYVVFKVRLNKEVLSSPLWDDGKKARLAFEAIVNTAAYGISESIRPTYPFSIHVLVDEKSITKLGKVKIKNPASAS